jgi:hypothetical protein
MKAGIAHLKGNFCFKFFRFYLSLISKPVLLLNYDFILVVFAVPSIEILISVSFFGQRLLEYLLSGLS